MSCVCTIRPGGVRPDCAANGCAEKRLSGRRFYDDGALCVLGCMNTVDCSGACQPDRTPRPQEPTTPMPTRPLQLALTEDSAARKETPMARGLLDYFPAALAYVSTVSAYGNRKHNPESEDLVWTRGKSNDHADTIMRHLADRGLEDSDGIRHSGYVAWRALAMLQEELEQAGLASPGRAAVLPEPDPCPGEMTDHCSDECPGTAACGGDVCELPTVRLDERGLNPRDCMCVGTSYELPGHRADPHPDMVGDGRLNGLADAPPFKHCPTCLIPLTCARFGVECHEGSR